MMKKFAIVFVVMMLGSFVAEAATLVVPFFRNGIGSNVRGVISLKNTTGSDAVLTVTYTSAVDPGGPGDFTDQAPFTFALVANASQAWQPVRDENSENNGKTIQNMTIKFHSTHTNPSCCGAAKIESDVAGIAGMYAEFNDNTGSGFGHVILPQ